MSPWTCSIAQQFQSTSGSKKPFWYWKIILKGRTAITVMPCYKKIKREHVTCSVQSNLAIASAVKSLPRFFFFFKWDWRRAWRMDLVFLSVDTWIFQVSSRSYLFYAVCFQIPSSNIAWQRFYCFYRTTLVLQAISRTWFFFKKALWYIVRNDKSLHEFLAWNFLGYYFWRLLCCCCFPLLVSQIWWFASQAWDLT